MTNITASWAQILNFAKEYGMPPEKKRAIIREYLQTKIVTLIYDNKLADGLFFVGGTALRILYGLDRFSQDLDFDAPEMNKGKIIDLLEEVAGQLERENLIIDFYKNFKTKKNYFEFRFGDILYETGISLNKGEKLMVKFDFEVGWKKQSREVVLLNRFGFLANVITKTLDQFVVEKMVAYVHRKQTQARDLYDLVWLGAQKAKFDDEFAKKNGFDEKRILKEALKKFSSEKLSTIETGLKPFLINEQDISKLAFFPQLFPEKSYEVEG